MNEISYGICEECGSKNVKLIYEKNGSYLFCKVCKNKSDLIIWKKS